MSTYLVWSNLGGQGPDTGAPPSMRFVNVAEVSHPAVGTIRIDLVLSNRSAYSPYDASLNTLNGKFAQVNLACNTAVDLRVSIVMSCASTRSCVACTEPSLSESARIGCYAAGCACYGETVFTKYACSGERAAALRAAYGCDQMETPIVLPSAALVSMTVYDFDTGVDGTYVEQLIVSEYEYFKTPLRPSSGESVSSTIYVNEADHIFTSTARGSSSDNPTDPQSLTAEQASRGIQFFFLSRDGYVDATFVVSGADGCTGRSLLFAGDSSLCAPPPPQPPALPPLPPPPSSPLPSMPPPTSPLPAAPPAQSQCVPGTIDLSFFDACETGSPAQDNLGGLGPDSGPEEIRYVGIGSLNGRPFDLIVKATTSYYTEASFSNGCSGLFGAINVWVRASMPFGPSALLAGHFAFTL